MNVCLYTAGIVLILYYFFSTLALGPVAFSAVLLCGGILLCGYAAFRQHFAAALWLKRIERILFPAAGAALILFFCAECFVIHGAAVRNREKSDYIVVLGAGLRKDRLSLTLQKRLDAVLACDQGETIVVSGGQGRNESLPEGRAMADYLIKNGIPESRILIEDRSVNTHENFRFSKTLIEAHSGRDIGESRVKIVTSDYHCCRAAMLARRQGYRQVCAYGSATHPLLVPSAYIREGLALIKSFLFDR